RPGSGKRESATLPPEAPTACEFCMSERSCSRPSLYRGNPVRSPRHPLDIALSPRRVEASAPRACRSIRRSPRMTLRRRSTHMFGRLALSTLLASGALVVSALAQSAPQPAPGTALAQRLEVDQKLTVAYPAGWTARQVGNLYRLFAASAEELDKGHIVLEDVASVVIHTEQRANRDDALLRLKQIEAESETPSRFVVIAGWPALQRQQIVLKPYSGMRIDPRP